MAVAALALIGMGVENAWAGPVRTVAGTGEKGYAGDGGLASKALMNNPFGITRGPDGMLYFCEFEGHVVRRIDAKGMITTVAGTGKAGFGGDGGPALQAELNKPHEVQFGPDGRLYISDMSNHAIRALDLKSGILSTPIGTGKPGFGGDGGPGTKAQFKDPISQTFGPDGLLYICDLGNQRVRTWDPASGVVRTVCGSGQKATPADGAAFSGSTPLSGPRTIAFDAAGQLWLALRDANSLYRVDLQERIFHHVAGTGKSGFAGNGGPAREAQLAGPKGLAISRESGRVLIADTESHSIRVVDPKTGKIEVLVGDGKKGDGPEGMAGQCRLARPHGLFLDSDGKLYIGDSENHRIRVLEVH
ncbi:MAG: vgb 3 [Verrucomicrobiales bacterium]|nr:vgb 3 [Verrucomicrobiales bacterium]